MEADGARIQCTAPAMRSVFTAISRRHDRFAESSKSPDLAARAFVLDGETIGLADDEIPPVPDTMGLFRRDESDEPSYAHASSSQRCISTASAHARPAAASRVRRG